MKINRHVPITLVPVIALLLGCSAPVEQEITPYTIPPIETTTLSEIRETIDSAKGTIVVINLWATWCPPCVVETPELSRYYEEFGQSDVTFLSISADELSEADTAVRLFVNSYEIPFPIHVLGPVEQEAFNTGLGIQWDGLYPGTFLIGPDGTVTKMWAGEVTYEQLKDSTESLLGD